MDIVVTIPAYNEEKTIAEVIKSIDKVMKKRDFSYKILVVDDGSRDRTAQILVKAGVIVVSHPRNYGLAETFKTEMKKCLELNPEIILHIDADGQYDPEEIPKLIKEVKNGYDLVLGSRFKGHIEKMPLVKRLGNIAFSKVISNITRNKISDGQTGFRAFTREVAKIPITSTHTYTQEQIIRASKEKFRIKEVPIYFKKRKGSTKSRLMKNPFDYALRAWLNLLRIYRDYEPIKFFGEIGGLFLFVGICIGIWFVYLHFTSGISGHLGMFFLMILLIMAGAQIAVLGFLADIWRK